MSPLPVNYSVYDIGKGGVPPLNAATIKLIRRIERYVPSATLRFAYPVAGPLSTVVYDAKNGACAFASYQVLNAPGIHNLIYNPGDDPTHMAAYPSDIPATPFPWMKAQK